MRIILLANSKKPGGRCLAGLDEAGNWVRPVSNSQGGAISRTYTLDSAGPLRPLDTIEFSVISAAPMPYQGENVLIDQSTIRRIGVETSDDPRLISEATRRSWFLEDGSSRIPSDTYLESSGAQSLSYIIATDFRAIRRVSAFRVSWRAVFTLGGEFVDFPLTDDLYTGALTASTDEMVAGLCISVGERFDKDDSHYKLVAGVVPLGAA